MKLCNDSWQHAFQNLFSLYHEAMLRPQQRAAPIPRRTARHPADRPAG